MERLEKLPGALLDWYGQNRRDLPWRENRDPYRVWLSEIMLQQTRVEAVKGYYTRFLQALPTVEALAACPEEKLLKLWEGLGYYSRARNLQRAAKILCRDYGGVFPREYSQVLALPGVGEYTAGAICSICYDQPTPGVDGNVLRVLARVLDIHAPVEGEKARFRQALAAVYPARAGDFTQALMELGATVCGPGKEPRCDLCPCRDFCLGRLRGTAASLPVRQPKRQKRTEERTVLILRWGSAYALAKRPPKGLLAGLWQLPDLPGTLELPQVLAHLEGLGARVGAVHRQTDKTHIFTHVIWHMQGYFLELSEPAEGFEWIEEARVEAQIPLPTAYRQFWEERHV